MSAKIYFDTDRPNSKATVVLTNPGYSKKVLTFSSYTEMMETLEHSYRNALKRIVYGGKFYKAA